LSDISLTFTWWEISLGFLAYGFAWLTIVAALAVFWWWRRRRSWPARIVAAAATLLWCVSSATNLLTIATQVKNQNAYESDLRARQTTLSRTMTLDGMRLPAGTVVTRSDTGDVAAVDLSAAVEIRHIPVVGHAGISSGALDGEVKLARDVRIGGAECASSASARFAVGKLAECLLAVPSTIDGIPCTGQVSLEPGVVCELSGNYRRFGYLWRRQTKITDYGDLVWFRIGSQPPSLLAFGARLPADSEVQFAHGAMASVDLRGSPARFRGCAIDLVMVQDGKVLGRTSGACSIPQAPNSMYVALPSTALRNT
jgi:hypothetical protein